MSQNRKSRPSLAAMRWAANALLLAMAGLYVAAVLLARTNGLWGYVRAFAEAALVGGLADWFAVTAIFRRPFGLPIPHTAVIPRSKNRIADALGEFVSVNFLAPEVVERRLAAQNLGGALARQLSDPATSRRIADALVDALPSLVDLLDDSTVTAFLRREIGALSRDARLSAGMGRVLRLLTDHGRHQPLLDAALNEGWKALTAHEPAIRAHVRARTGWLWRLLSLDARAADAMIGATEDTLAAIAADAAHPARRQVTQMLERLADDLQNSAQLQAQIERIVAETLAHPSVGAYFQDLLSSLKAAVRRNAESPNSALRDTLSEALTRFGAAMQADTEVQDAVNRRLRAMLSALAGRHGRDVASLISETIKGWDSKTMVDKLEQNVGPDLQYIRINGTLIGGLIGLILHQLTLALATLAP